MDATLADDVVRTNSTGRERFYDSRGYGHPVDGGALELAPVEAAHLLYRGDLDAVDGMGFRSFLGSAAVSESAFLVYKDLRDRGFYLAPAREGWGEGVPAGAAADPNVDFVVFPRGNGPWDEEVAYRVAVVGEREPVPASPLGDAVLAVVDEESELTYLRTDRPEITGSTTVELPEGIAGTLLADRVFLWNAPARLYESGFYGQRLDDDAGGGGSGGAGDGDGDGGVLQLSLLEAAHLSRRGAIAVEGGADAVIERGRDVEGGRFDRRLAVYEALRAAGVVPKTGFKFGADFRTYADVTSVDELGHSELLVRVRPADAVFDPRDLALDVRLAHGVRKTMVFALVGGDGEGEGEGPDVTWLSVERLTP